MNDRRVCVTNTVLSGGRLKAFKGEFLVHGKNTVVLNSAASK